MNVSESRTVDLTPAGCQTPEGVARVNAAMRDVDQANAECARLLDSFLGYVAMLGMREAWAEVREEVSAAMLKRREATEEFLRALSNAPAASRKGEGGA